MYRLHHFITALLIIGLTLSPVFYSENVYAQAGAETSEPATQNESETSSQTDEGTEDQEATDDSSDDDMIEDEPVLTEEGVDETATDELIDVSETESETGSEAEGEGDEPSSDSSEEEIPENSEANKDTSGDAEEKSEAISTASTTDAHTGNVTVSAAETETSNGSSNEEKNIKEEDNPETSPTSSSPLQPEEQNGTTLEKSTTTKENGSTTENVATSTAVNGSSTVSRGDVVPEGDFASASSTGTQSVSGSGLASSTPESDIPPQESISASVENAEKTVTPLNISSSTASQTATSAPTTTLAHVSSSTPATSTESTATSTLATSTPTTTNIVSGKAVALANILNLVNTNFVNSDGVVLFSNFFDAMIDALDLRSLYTSLFGLSCSLSSCSGDNTEVHIANDGSIENSLFLEALTGGNTIEGADSAAIETGDAYAGLNLVNVANSNFIDSNYLLVTINAFDDVNNDIIFPSLSNFFKKLAGGASAPSVIDVENSADIQNDVSLTAGSGNNGIDGADDAAITTGDAHTSGNVFNQINTSLIGDQSVSIIFRVHGTWAGEIFGAPDNLLWTTGDDGSIFIFDNGQVSNPAESEGSSSIHGTNTARIQNDVDVVALTGDNAINDSNTALISTGNAFAGANIINIANTNVVGRNWILAIINIFGNFTGNIAFGRPDLWVGQQLNVPSRVANGSEVTYTLTVINNGDSDATNVVLTDIFENAYMDIQHSSHAYTLDTKNKIAWELGTLPPGGAAEITYTAHVKNTSPGMELENISEVRARETDNNLKDNTDIVAFTTYKKKGGNGIRISLSEEKAKRVKASLALLTQSTSTVPVTLELERIAPVQIFERGEGYVRQEIVIRNASQYTAKNVVLRDLLTDMSGEVIRNEMWEFGDMRPHEEIVIGYNLGFAENAAPGTYTLEAALTASNAPQEAIAYGTVAVEASLKPAIANGFSEEVNRNQIAVVHDNEMEGEQVTVSEIRVQRSLWDLLRIPHVFAGSVYTDTGYRSTTPPVISQSLFDHIGKFFADGVTGVWSLLSQSFVAGTQ